MKTERRHELQTNTLAQEITLWSDKLRPYANVLIGGVGVLLALYAVSTMWMNYRGQRDVQSWDAYQMAVLDGDIELKDLQRIAAGDEFAGTKMQEWAYVTWADRQLLLASQQYLSDREGAKKNLNEVAAVYEQFAQNGSDPEIRNRSRLGWARVNEMQDRLDEACRQYGLVEGAIGELAAKRAKELESKQTQEDIKWLATASLPKPARAAGAQSSAQRPGFEASTPAADAPGESPIDSSKSLEDVLGSLGAGSEETDRYGESKGEAAKDAAAEAKDAPATDAGEGGAKPAEGSDAPAGK